MTLKALFDILILTSTRQRVLHGKSPCVIYLCGKRPYKRHFPVQNSLTPPATLRAKPADHSVRQQAEQGATPEADNDYSGAARTGAEGKFYLRIFEGTSKIYHG